MLYRHLPAPVRTMLDAAIASCERSITEDVALGEAGGGTDLPDILDAKEAEDPDVLSWRDALPPKYRSQYDLAFLQKYLGALRAVSKRIHEGRAPVASCTAQELAFRYIAEVTREAGEENGWGDEDDDAFGSFCDEAVADSDAELLFDMSSDGIEDDEDMAHLRFDEWFIPFRSGAGG